MQAKILQANSQSLNYDDVFGQIAYINGISWYKGTFEAHKLACELRHVSYWTNIAHYAVALIDNSASYFMGGITSITPRSFSTDGGMDWTMVSFSTDDVSMDFHKVIALKRNVVSLYGWLLKNRESGQAGRAQKRLSVRAVLRIIDAAIHNTSPHGRPAEY